MKHPVNPKVANQGKLELFFKRINLLGGVLLLSQSLVFISIDQPSSTSLLIASLITFGSVLLYQRIGFRPTKYFTYFAIMVFAGFASLRVGWENFFFLNSITVIVAAIITSSLQEKTFIYSLIAFKLLFLGVQFSNYFKAPGINEIDLESFKILNVLFFIIFICIEVLFLWQTNMTEESKLESKATSFKKSSEEKDELVNTLTKEVHHRVNNNLQLLNSLNRFPSSNSNEKKLEIANFRLEVLAIMHRELFKSNNTYKINLKHFVNEVFTKNPLIQEKGLETTIICKNCKDVINPENASPFAILLAQIIICLSYLPFNPDKQIELELTLTKKGSGLFVTIKRINSTMAISIPESDIFSLLVEQLNGTHHQNNELEILNLELSNFYQTD